MIYQFVSINGGLNDRFYFDYRSALRCIRHDYWDYSRKWGFLPSGGFGLATLIVGAMWFYGRI